MISNEQFPPTLDIPTACRLLGISRGLGYELARRGEFPVAVLRMGRRLRVPTAELLDLLGLRPAHRQSDAADLQRRTDDRGSEREGLSGGSS